MKLDNEENAEIESLLKRLQQLDIQEIDIEEIRRGIERAKEQAREQAKLELQSRAPQQEDPSRLAAKLIGSASLGAIAATSISLLFAPALFASTPIILSGIGALIGLASNMIRPSNPKLKEAKLIQKRLEEEIIKTLEKEVRQAVQQEVEELKKSERKKTDTEKTEEKQ